MVEKTPIPLDFPAGIDNDGTQLDSTACINGQWCRWRLGRPRSMGGYRRITDSLAGIPRRIHMFYQGSTTIIHVGTTVGIQQVVIDQFGNLVSIADRTPAGFIGGLNVGWTIDAIFDTTSSAVQLVCSAVPDDGFVSSPTQTVPYIGIITDTTPLLPFSDPGAGLYAGGTWTQPKIAGGIACVQPYVFDFDIDGKVQWSAPNLPLTLGLVGGTSGAGQARISAQKIVQGAPLRGGGSQQPAVIFWSLSEVITGVFVGTPAFFSFSTVSPSSSILSSDSVVEYDGLYFWAGIDRFLVFNGTVTEVPNRQNQDWFFDNINRAYSARAYAFKIPRYGEIWFCAPLFGATECSHAAIYNLRENAWYSTTLPNSGRGAAYFAQGFANPVMGGVGAGPNGYKLWMHETGTDEVDGSVLAPVRKFFQTPYMGSPKNQQPSNEGLSSGFLEPDFIQTGDMSVYLIGIANVRAPVNNGTPEVLKLVPTTTQEQFVSFKETHRLTSIHIESNVLGGSFIAGRNLFHASPAFDARLMS